MKLSNKVVNEFVSFVVGSLIFDKTGGDLILHLVNLIVLTICKHKFCHHVLHIAFSKLALHMALIYFKGLVQTRMLIHDDILNSIRGVGMVKFRAACHTAADINILVGLVCSTSEA